MRSFLPILSALATASSAAALPASAAAGVPNLPDGPFMGFNNPDGTTTLQFIELNQNFTFTPNDAPEPASGLQKRVAGSSCWGGALDSQGVDRGMNQMRQRTDQSPVGLGQWSDWPPYFGYNNLGVYVYFCVNSASWNYFHGFTRGDLEAMSGQMNRDCGVYRDGYTWHNEYSDFLFGMVKSGTRICLGNSRS